MTYWTGFNETQDEINDQPVQLNQIRMATRANQTEQTHKNCLFQYNRWSKYGLVVVETHLRHIL